MIIIDDTERSGEAALANPPAQLATRAGHQIKQRIVAANSRQAVVACGKFEAAASF